MPIFKSSTQWLLILSIIYVIPFLSSLHNLLDSTTRCNNHNDVSQSQTLHIQPTAPISSLFDTSSPHHKLPGTSVPNPKEGIPNILLTTRTDPPFHMFVYPPDVDRYISRNIIQHGIYEGMTTKLVTNYLPTLLPSTSESCDINLVLDMGSNLGYYSLLAASRGYNVVSFEASPDTAWLQQSSAALNGFTSSNENRKSKGAGSLLLISKGVSDIPSTGRMARHAGSPGMTSFASTTDFNLQPGTNGSALDANIELVRAGDILAELGLQNNNRGNVTIHNENQSKICYKLLKIDVEGFEEKALHGLGNLTTTYPFEIIVMEYFPSMLRSAGATDPMDVLRYIAMQGYDFYVIEKKGTVGLRKVEDLEVDDQVKKVDGSGDHINLMAKRIVV